MLIQPMFPIKIVMDKKFAGKFRGKFRGKFNEIIFLDNL